MRNNPKIQVLILFSRMKLNINLNFLFCIFNVYLL
jgi:hypothetical protein